MRKALFVSGLAFCLAAAVGLLWLQNVSSAQSAGAELVIYTGENFTGVEYRVTETLLDMPKGVDDGPAEFRYGWNDNVKSIKVIKGTFRLCMHGRLNTQIDETPVESLSVEAAKAKGQAAGWSCLVSGSSAGSVLYPTPDNGVWGSDISSIQLLSQENLPDWASLSYQ